VLSDDIGPFGGRCAGVQWTLSILATASLAIAVSFSITLVLKADSAPKMFSSDASTRSTIFVSAERALRFAISVLIMFFTL